MARLCNIVMGSVDSCPYVPRSKCIAPAVGAGLVLGGASLVGNALSNIFGSANQAAANRTNLQIARENNENQYRMFQEQNQFNLDMWNKQNEYNLPQAQVQRLLAAGINPSAVFGNGQVSEAGSLTSAPAPTLQMAQVHPFMPNIDTSGAVNAFLQSQMQNEQRKLMASQRNNVEANTAHTQVLTEYEQKSMFDRLHLLYNQAQKEGVLGDLARQQIREIQDNYWFRNKLLRQDIRANDQSYEMQNRQMENLDLQNKLLDLQLIYQPKMNEAELRQYGMVIKQIQSVIGFNNANTLLTKQERLTEIKKGTQVALDNAGKVLDNNLKRAIFKYAVGQAQEDYAKKYNENRYWTVGPDVFEKRHVVGDKGYYPKNVDSK